MQVSRETKILNIICVCLVLSAGFIRFIAKPEHLFPYNGIIFILFSSAALLWIYQLYKRLLQPEVRRDLVSAALLMILWMELRTVKYDILPDGHIASRYAWYLYYIPMICIPLFIFLSALAIGRPHNRPIDRRWYLLFIPAGIIALGILTNDVHQCAFRFADGLGNWSDHSVDRGFVYYAAMAWIVVTFIAITVTVLVRCTVSGRKKKIWLPLLIISSGLMYMLSYDLILERLPEFLTMPEVSCFIYAAFAESLILLRLLPSNDNYGVLWNASSVGAGIMDEEGNICFRSEKSREATPEQVKLSQNGTVLLEKGSVALRSHAIRGGYGYWTRDISEINRLNGELEELGNVTEEENSMLRAENKMESDRIRIEEQNRLYDDMARGVKKQLDELNDMLTALPEDEDSFEEAMKYACVLNAYVKRHSNLILLAHRSGIIHSEEFLRAVDESLEYVRLIGVKAQCFFDGSGNLGADGVLFAHGILEDVLEASLPCGGGILVYFKVTGRGFIMRVEVSSPARLYQPDGDGQKPAEGLLETEFEDGTEYITLTVSGGGDSL